LESALTYTGFMTKDLLASLRFLNKRERLTWIGYLFVRSSLSFLDLLGILAIGFITLSSAKFFTEGSDPSRIVKVGSLSLPALSAKSLPIFLLAVVLLFVIKAALSITLTKATANFVATVESRASNEILKYVFESGLERVAGFSNEKLLYTIQSSCLAAFNGILNASSSLITEGALFIAVFIGFVFVDPMTALATLGYFILVAAVMNLLLGRLVTKASRRLAISSVDAGTRLTDLMQSYKEIKVADLSGRFISRINESRVQSARSLASQYHLRTLPRYVIELALIFGVIGILALQLSNGDITKSATTLGVFLTGGLRLTAAMLPLQAALVGLNQYGPQAAFAHELLGRPDFKKPSSVHTDAYENVDHVETSNILIEFDSVSFKYKERQEPVLENISFSVRRGMQLAIIGPSGAGKSTIIDLICGLLEPATGFISKNASLASRGVAYIPQKPGIISGTFANNVALAFDPGEIDRKMVSLALDKAGLGNFVEALPLGIDSDLGEARGNLSGGQLQRLAFARAFYRSPELLVMDEGTSSLDAKSESEISKLLLRLKGDMTVVVVAHRLHTIQNADEVLMLDDGKITDRGSFAELLNRNASLKDQLSLLEITA
jgi:ABC-type multidrug transport system fused ATPase/permease subunit